MYVIEYCDQVSCRYHSSGGLVIIAENREEAQKLANADKYINVTDQDIAEAKEYNLTKKYDEEVFVFPDAGCC